MQLIKQSFFDELFSPLFIGDNNSYWPSFCKDGSDTQIKIAIPGAKKQDVDVNVSGRKLVVDVKNSFRGIYSIPLDADINTSRAFLEDGILTVKFKYIDEKEPWRKVEIN